MSRRSLFLVNSHSRQGQRRRDQARSALQALGLEWVEETLTVPHQLPHLIRAYRDRVDSVIIGGGDGTLNLAVDALVETQIPLGILPMGTANDLARTLNLPVSIPEACQVIAQGKLQAIDLGWVNGKHFFNVASLGLSVRITHQLQPEVKRNWGVLAYPITAGRVLARSRPFFAEIRIPGESFRVSTVQIAVGNGRYYGGGLAIASDATIDDQRLDLYSLGIDHWWQMIGLLPALSQGYQKYSPYVFTLRNTELEIHTLRPRPINTDGEITTQTPARFRVIPHALSVFVP